MFPKYFETIACEHLVGTGVKPEYIKDDKLGRVMDKLFIKGLDTIFFIIVLKAAKKFGVSLSSSHLDSSSIHVHGQYNTSLPEVIFESKAAQSTARDSLKSNLQLLKILYFLRRSPMCTALGIRGDYVAVRHGDGGLL